jgi:hypothetical protein
MNHRERGGGDTNKNTKDGERNRGRRFRGGERDVQYRLV